MTIPTDKTATVLSPLDSRVDPWNTTAAAAITFTYQFATTSQPTDLTFASFSGWTAFTTAQMNSVSSVFAEIASVANLNFQQVTGNSDPDFNLGRVSLGSGEGGQGGYSYSFFTNGGGQVTSKTIDGYAVWRNDIDLTTQDNRSILLHEILHALTLKHPGAYDVGGNIPPGPYLPASEDSNKYTVMSYNVDPDNGLNSDHLMLYDIAALQQRFGANMTTNTGNDTYTGPAGGRIQTIWDAGGNDTFDGSAISTGVSINLNEGAFSSMGALNNMSIAYNVVIENAIGGAGNDTLIGNTADNTLKGGLGTDTLDGRAGIDTAVFTGLRSAYTITHSGISLVVSGPNGTDTLTHIEKLAFDDGTIPSGITPVYTDFNTDDHSDLLWRNDNGGVSSWDMNDHTFAGFTFNSVPTSWHIAGKGDFNGDGTADIVWRNDNGAVSTWDMNDHSFTGFDFAPVPTAWQIVGTGDFNGDGKTDILWRDSSGNVATWDMNDHTFVGFNFAPVPTNWQVVGTGDFNGDGKTDILWRDSSGNVATWDMNDHTFVGFNFGAVPTSWTVAGTGDFNGDGITDILWRNTNGGVSTWDMHDHTFVGFDFGIVPTSWQVAGTGDFNSDGKTDIVWRNTNGAVSTWDMNDHTYTGFDFSASTGSVPTSWHIS